jgi:hypothetical protein
LQFIVRFEHLTVYISDAKSRFAGSENDMAGSHFVNYLWDSTLEAISKSLFCWFAAFEKR